MAGLGAPQCGLHSPNTPPGYGLLTRTLIHSPVVKKILPARIRRFDLYDVVFIGETFIELHLLTESGKLQKVGSKTDFRAEIRDARVFGSQRESNLSGLPRDESMSSDGSEDFKRRLPADILVLTMSSGHLAFVYAKDTPEQGQVEFIISMKRIDSKGVHPTLLGKSIAVDPHSRAMAVTAYQDSFRIYSLHTMEDIHRRMSEGLPLDPIKEERTFDVKGAFIVHMEFLYPSPEDKDQVLLVLFLIDSTKKSRLQLYEWGTSKSLQTAAKQGQHGLRLSEDISIPIHLIPLVIRSAFLLVTEFYTHVVQADDIRNGITGGVHKLAIHAAGSDAYSQKQPLVAAWARPYRHPEYSGFHDDMYLAMENGDIYYMEVEETQSNNALVQATSKASFLKCSIGTAFAVLDNGLGNDDRIVAGGEMSSGGIYLLNISAYAVDAGAKQEESVTNWAPVFDFELVNLSARGQGNEGTAERDRVYACTGRGDHGAITELRYGIQATARRPEPVDGLQGVRQLFILPDTSGGGYFVLSSLADQSFLCYRSSGRDGEWLSCEGIDSLELDETTLAAGSMELPSGNDVPSTLWSVQITQNAITILQLSRDDIKPEVGMEASEISRNRRLQRRCDGGDTIISAAIHGRFVLLTLRNGSDVNVVLASIEVKQDSDEFLVPIGAPVALTDDPTFIGIIELRDRVMAVVGTRQATLLIFQCDDSQGLRFIKEQAMSDHATESQHDLNFCESAVMLSTDSAAKLLCGLRGGTVVVFNVTASESTPELDLKLVRSQDIRFGPIPVQLYLDVHRKDLAFALAGPEVYRFDMPCDSFRAAQLVFVVQDKDIDPAIQSIVQVNSPIDGNNTLVCVTNDQIFCADVGENCKICARRLKLYETPRRLLFYEPLGMFIVACVKTVGRDSTGLYGDRKSFCSLKIIDPKTGDSRLSDGELRDSVKKDLIFGKPNEQIYCLAEWNMELNGNLYQYVALGTGSINPNLPGVSGGRVIVLSLRRNADGMVEIRKRTQVICDEPVYSLAPYGSSSLLYCSGTKLYMIAFNLDTKKLDVIAETKLRSSAVQISVSEQLIYLSCASDSILVVKFENNKLVETFSDEVARNGFHHVKLLQDLVIATDKQYSIVGLWQPQNKPTLQSLTTIFEADLTSSVSRIRRGICRPPWVPPTRHLPGVISGTENVIAAGVDGSFFQLTILDERGLRLLRFVQKLYREETTGAPFAPPEPEPEARDPRTAHIDGDLLAVVVRLGVDWLRRAVGRSEEGREYAFEGSEGFQSVAVELLGDKEDVYEATMRYVDELVNDAVL